MLKTIGATRLLNSPHPQVLKSSRVTPLYLKMLNRALDRITWCFETLESTHSETLHRVRSPRALAADWRTFKRLQDVRSETRYINFWKQFLHYVFRTAPVGKTQREVKYGIKFSDEQLGLIEEMLKPSNSGDGENTNPNCYYYGDDYDDEEEEQKVPKYSKHRRFDESLGEPRQLTMTALQSSFGGEVIPTLR